MRILLDENIDRLLKTLFDPEHEVVTVQECGWGGMKNGALLRTAEQEFDAFVTMDKNLEYQQNLNNVDLRIVVLKAKNNAYISVAPLMPEVNEVLKKGNIGKIIHVPDA